MKIKMPKELLIYVCDYIDGKPLYAAVRNVDEIPEDENSSKVGIYILQSINTFKVSRELQ